MEKKAKKSFSLEELEAMHEDDDPTRGLWIVVYVSILAIIILVIGLVELFKFLFIR